MKNMMNKYAGDAVTTIHEYKKGGDIIKASNAHPSKYGMLEKSKGKNEKILSLLTIGILLSACNFSKALLCNASLEPDQMISPFYKEQCETILTPSKRSWYLN